MKKATDHILFSSSKQDKAHSDLIEMSPDSMLEWRNNLALSDIGVAAKKIYLVLHDMHRVKISATDRLTMLETIRPTVSFICTHLSKHISDDANILTSKRNKIALLIQTLQLETAEGYRIIIDQLGDTKTHKKLLLTAIYRLMSFEYKVLAATYQLYAIPPEGLWHEMHLLYRFADKHGLLNKSISQDTVVQIRHKNILDAYKHCLIMSLANPFRLTHKEIQQLNYVLEDWVKLVTLTPLSKIDDALYSVDLNQDQGPIYTELALKNSSGLLAIDLDKLTAHIQNLIRLKLPNTPLEEQEAMTSLENMIDTSFLEKLFIALTQHLERAEKRISVAGKMRVTFGLSSVHYFLERSLSQDTDNSSKETSNEIVLSSEVSADEHLPVNSYYCTIVNESPSGFCLEWSENPPHELNALELIGLELKENKKTTWLIGSIQWLRQTDSKMQAGVKILSPFAKAIRIQLEGTDELPSSKWMSALLLPEFSTFRQPQTVIAPYLPFKEGSTVNIAIDDDEMKGTLSKTLFKAHHYKQFIIEYAHIAPHLDFNILSEQKSEHPVWRHFSK